MKTEVGNLDGRLEQPPRAVGKDHLAAIRDRANARGPVDVEADVPLVRSARLAGVHAYAHPYRPAGERALGVPRRPDRALCICERDEERVALRVDLDAAVALERATERTTVLSENLRVAVAEVGQEACRALDVGEQQRDGAGRQIAHRNSMPDQFGAFGPGARRRCAWQDSNLRPCAPEAHALSPELQARGD